MQGRGAGIETDTSEGRTKIIRKAPLELADILAAGQKESRQTFVDALLFAFAQAVSVKLDLQITLPMSEESAV